MRLKFLDLIDASIAVPLTARLTYIFAVQSWKPLAEYRWIHVALKLLLGSVDEDEFLPPLVKQNSAGDGIFIEYKSTQNRCVGTVIRPLRRPLCLDPTNAGKLWVSMFSSIWSTLSRKEQTDFGSLLTHEYSIKHAEIRRLRLTQRAV